MAVITIVSQKGGCGKTTTAAALAEAAASEGKKVLAVDLDTGDLTFSLAADADGGNSYDLITGTPAADIIRPAGIENIDIIPAAPNPVIVPEVDNARLKNVLRPYKKKFDYIIIDTPQGFGTMQLNGIEAADLVIIPLQAKSYSVKTLYQQAAVIGILQEATRKKTKAAAIVTMYDQRPNLAKDTRAGLIDALQELNIIYAGAVRAGSKIDEAATMQESIYKYAPNSNPAKDYLAVYHTIEQILL